MTKSKTKNSKNNNKVIDSDGINSKVGYKAPLSNPYYLTIIIRFIVGILAIGYIHPDEYFQSPEITSSFMFNYKTFKPWEFSDDNPCRSVVIPLFNSGISFYILKQIQNLVDFIIGGNGIISIINGNSLIIAPRIFMICLSFSLDYYIVLICKSFNLSYRKSLVILSSCWLVIIFHSRTFSNTIESLLVATLLTLVLLYNNNNNNKFKMIIKDLLIGCVVSCGIFARFTFIFFAAPIGLYLFYIFSQKSSSKSISSIILSTLFILFGFIITSSIFVIIDSIYFKYLIIDQIIPPVTITGYNFTPLVNQISTLPLFLNPSETLSNINSLELISFFKNNLTFTPVNSFLYNLDIKNLSDHGIHNRLTHLLVNLPMMVGPLALLLVIEIVGLIKNNSSSSSSNDTKKQNDKNQQHKEQFPKSVRILLISVIVSGLFFLSLAPHQEPRFLLPLFFPLLLLTYRYFYFNNNKKTSKSLLVIWILFNMSLTMFFGVIHQGSVTQSLINIGTNIVKQQQQKSTVSNNNNNITIIYYHTYMPPRHLLGIDKDNEKINVVDLGGGETSTLISTVEKTINSKIYILSPTKSILYQQYKDKTCQFIDSFWPHLTTEDAPNSIDEARLFMFECIDLV